MKFKILFYDGDKLIHEFDISGMFTTAPIPRMGENVTINKKPREVLEVSWEFKKDSTIVHIILINFP